jgi:hypothetical protein
VSLQSIRKAIDTLRAHAVDDLAGTTLMSDGTTYYKARSPADLVDLLQGGQASRDRRRRRVQEDQEQLAAPARRPRSRCHTHRDGRP